MLAYYSKLLENFFFFTLYAFCRTGECDLDYNVIEGVWVEHGNQKAKQEVSSGGKFAWNFLETQQR